MLKIILELYKMSMVLYIKQLKFKFTLQVTKIIYIKLLNLIKNYEFRFMNLYLFNLKYIILSL